MKNHSLKKSIVFTLCMSLHGYSQAPFDFSLPKILSTLVQTKLDNPQALQTAADALTLTSQFAPKELLDAIEQSSPVNVSFNQQQQALIITAKTPNNTQTSKEMLNATAYFIKHLAAHQTEQAKNAATLTTTEQNQQPQKKHPAKARRHSLPPTSSGIFEDTCREMSPR